MYEAYWKLSGKPFPQRIASDRFYQSRSHQAALLRLKYGLENFNGPGLILGMSGTGKSSLIRFFAEQNPEYRPFVHLVFPALNCDELLRMIAADLSGNGAIDNAGTDLLLKNICQSIRQHSDAGRRSLICFDDAHSLSENALQNVVLPLLSIAESDSNMLLSIVLVGQPILASKIRRIGSLSERIAVTTPLPGFTERETADFVISTLRSVQGQTEIFSETALQRLFEATGGNPRRICRLCDMALLVGFAEQLEQITENQIDAVNAELMPAAA